MCKVDVSNCYRQSVSMTGKLGLHKVDPARYMQFVTTSNILNLHLLYCGFLVDQQRQRCNNDDVITVTQPRLGCVHVVVARTSITKQQHDDDIVSWTTTCQRLPRDFSNAMVSSLFPAPHRRFINNENDEVNITTTCPLCCQRCD